jgi:hypothetical protein
MGSCCLSGRSDLEPGGAALMAAADTGLVGMEKKASWSHPARRYQPLSSAAHKGNRGSSCWLLGKLDNVVVFAICRARWLVEGPRRDVTDSKAEMSENTVNVALDIGELIALHDGRIVHLGFDCL